VLRVARFATRYQFDIAEDTMVLMKKLVDDGELTHLTAERVWSEFEKAMAEDNPSSFFWSLSKCGAKQLLFAELGNSLISTGFYLRQAALLELPIVQRMMIIFSGIPVDDAKIILDRLKAPSEIFRLSRKMRLISELAMANDVSPEQVFDTLRAVDAFGNTSDMKTVMFTLMTCHGARRNDLCDILFAIKGTRDITFASLSTEQRNELSGKNIGNAINDLRLEKIGELFR